MLTNHQLEEVRRYKTLSDFFANPVNVAIYSGYAPFNNEVTLFNANYTTLTSFVPNKDVITKGITSDKETLKQQGADALIIVMDKTRAYALKYNNASLAAQMNTNASAIFHIDDEDFQAYVQNICNSITANAIPDPLFASYNVAAGDLTAVLATATSFNALIGQAKNLASTATTANTDINTSLKACHDNITQFDLLINHFALTNADFVQGYHINSSVDNIPIRHTGIEGIITGGPTAIPLNGATVTLVNTNKAANTDMLGHYSLVRMMPGNYQVQVSMAGYQTKTNVIRIRRGHIESIFVQLPVNS